VHVYVFAPIYASPQSGEKWFLGIVPSTNLKQHFRHDNAII
ncbi:hypothetical protein LCGC14_2030660, partial [marine sediment metagenome]